MGGTTSMVLTDVGTNKYHVATTIENNATTCKKIQVKHWQKKQEKKKQEKKIQKREKRKERRERERKKRKKREYHF